MVIDLDPFPLLNVWAEFFQAGQLNSPELSMRVLKKDREFVSF